MNFNCFIGVDWVGAKVPGRGLKVAQCFLGTEVPQIISNGNSRNWRRKDVLDWLILLHNEGQKVLTGFDFAFAYPYCDEKAYFPEHNATPENVKSLWRLIDSICREAKDFYGGPFYLKQEAPFANYLLYQNYRGSYYNNRMRITDNLCASKAGNPASPFKCVGPESVGIGSVAGMRFLHEVNSNFNKDFSIWPFQLENIDRSVIVEIFPRFFYILAGTNPREWGNRCEVNNTLKYFDSDELSPDIKIESEDQIDAIISAAAIRQLASNPVTWHPPGLKNKCARTFELLKVGFLA